MVFDLEMILQI